MKSSNHGTDTSVAEITNISAHGIWLFAAGSEYFLPYTQYPWFKEATVGAICNIEVFGGTSFHWPDLDVDLSLDILQNPQNFPLQSH